MVGRNVAVIGSGPSGLVTMKYLLHEGYFPVCFEKSSLSLFGGTFANKAYDDSRLVSSKYLTPFSDFRLSDEEAAHQTLPDYCTYLRAYAEKFHLLEHIRFETEVISVSRAESGGYLISLINRCCNKEENETSQLYFDMVAICSGLHNVPRVPDVRGLNSFPGMVFHSSAYRSRSIFTGKRVLIIGAGETGMDIAYRAVQTASSVLLCTRTGFLSVPSIFGDKHSGLPLDTLITNLFESAYEHRWIHYLHLKWAVTTILIRFGFLLATGSSGGFNQWAGTVNPVRRGYHIINKSTAAMPYINRSFKEKSRFGWLYRWWDGDISGDSKVINLFKGGITEINGSTVSFGNRIPDQDFDTIVWATGYRQYFPFLHKGGLISPSSTLGVKNGDEDPLPPANEGHHITTYSEPTLAYIGFVRPNVGAIPPMSELQVMWWIERLKGKISGPISTPSYHLLARKLQYGVDYGIYMHQLARDIGSAPSLWFLLLNGGIKAVLSYALGQAYVTFFRVQGPYNFRGAMKIAAGELFRPVLQRGAIANILFIVVLIPFGIINFLAWLIDNMISATLALANV